VKKRPRAKSKGAGLDEFQINHKVYDAVADVLHRHPSICLDDVMARHRLATAIARGLHGRFVPAQTRRGFRRLLP
jgi:hypothetical protein